jgi:nucleoside-diphosphate-sugar epimerase
VIEKNNSSINLLIVGGSGFIGSHIVKEAINLGMEVTIISRNKISESKKQLHAANYLNVDISDDNKLKEILNNKRFHYVINLGGYVDHTNYFVGGNKVFDVHFNGTKNLVDSIDRSFLKCFIQIGSSDEYGHNSAPQNEEQRELSFSPYSVAKTASTHFLQMLYRADDFPVVVLRPFLVYGPGQNSKRFIPQIINGCLNNKNFSTSEGSQLRDFCYIDDFVQSVFFALESSKALGEVINISSGKPIAIKEVIVKIQNMISTGTPMFGSSDYRKGENMSLYADISKAKKILNWQPKVSIDIGLERTIDSFRG